LGNFIWPCLIFSRAIFHRRCVWKRAGRSSVRQHRHPTLAVNADAFKFKPTGASWQRSSPDWGSFNGGTRRLILLLQYDKH